MLLLNIVTLVLLISTAAPAPTAQTDASGDTEDDDLETSETGHFRRKRIWRKLIKQLSGLGGYGVPGYGLGAYGLGAKGLDLLLTELGGHLHKPHHHSLTQHGYGGGGHHGQGGHAGVFQGYGGASSGNQFGIHAPGYGGMSFGGYAPTFGYGTGLSFGTLGHEAVAPDLGLWTSTLDFPRGYSWAGGDGFSLGDIWI